MMPLVFIAFLQRASFGALRLCNKLISYYSVPQAIHHRFSIL